MRLLKIVGVGSDAWVDSKFEERAKSLCGVPIVVNSLFEMLVCDICKSTEHATVNESETVEVCFSDMNQFVFPNSFGVSL